MTESASFLQAILESPGDQTLRQVFADWLEERGDPRGEFIRVQGQLESTDEWQRGRSKLLKRESALRREHLRAWAAPVCDWGWKYQFRGGFVTHVETTFEEFVARAPELFASQPVTSVKLQSFNGGNETLQAFLKIPQLRQIRNLSIAPGAYLESREQARGIDDERLEMLLDTELFRPSDFELFGYGLTSRAMRLLARWPGLANLESLSLGCFAPGAEWAELSQTRLEKLRKLSLTRFSLERQGATALLWAASAWPNLDELSLQSTRLGSNGTIALAGGDLLQRLAHLDLTSNQIGVKGIEALGLALSPKLKSLELGGNRAGDNGGKSLAFLVDSSRAEGLRVLGLRRNRVDDAGLKVIASSTHLSGLLSLDLRYSRVSVEGAKVLGRSTTLTSLRQLDLRNVFRRKLEREALRAEFGPRFARL